MADKKYTAPRDGAVLEFAKIIVSVSGALGAKVSEINGEGGSANSSLIFGNVVIDGNKYTNEEAAAHFIEHIEGVVNEDRDLVKSVWSKMDLFRSDPYADNWEESEEDDAYTVTFNNVLRDAPTEDKKFYQFVILVDAVAHCRMQEYYNALLPEAFGIDVIPQSLRAYVTEIPDYVYLNENIIEDCSLSKLVRHYQGCIRTVSEVVINIAATSIIGLFKDEPRHHLLGSFIVNNLFNRSIDATKGDALFLLDKNGVRCNPVYVLKLTNCVLDQLTESRAFSLAWSATIPKVVNTDSVLTDLAMYNFIGLIRASDSYMGKYALIDDDQVLYKKSMFNSIAGLYQYAHVALSLSSGQDRQAELMAFKSMIYRATKMYTSGGITDYIWYDLVGTLLFKRDNISASPKNMVLYSQEKKELTPVLSMYTIIAPHVNGKLYRGHVPYITSTYIHQEFHQMLDLMTFLMKFSDDQLCGRMTGRNQYSGLILLYNILIVAHEHIKLTRYDIIDLYEFLHACVPNGSGKLLLYRVGHLVDPNSEAVRNININSVVGDSSSLPSYPGWKSIPEAGLMFDVTSRLIYYIRVLLWLSKATVYKASRIIKYLESIRQDNVDTMELIETKTIDDIIRDMD